MKAFTVTTDKDKVYTLIRYNNCNSNSEYKEYDGTNDIYMNSCLDLSIPIPTKYYNKIADILKNRQ